MKCKYLLSILVLLFATTLLAQPPTSKAEYEKEYERRIQQDVLSGIYIPKDLTDAFIQLNKLVDEESKMSFKSMPEDTAAHKLFFSFGRWITYNWGFYGGSRLSHHIRELGVTHPEDMAQFIIIAYHRNLNRNPLNIKELVERFQEKQRAEHLKKLEEGKVLYEETRKVEKKASGGNGN